MAGAQISGGQREIVITKKPIPNNPEYPPLGLNRRKIKKQSEAELKQDVMKGPIKIGIRVKQSESVEEFKIIGKNGTELTLTPTPPQGNPPIDPVADDLAAALGVGSDEKWVTYTSSYDNNKHGKKFDTKLVLNPFECHANGVRVFMIAITYSGLFFANDHYVYGLSILPGEASRGYPIDLTVAAPQPKPAAKKKKKKQKTAKKKPAKRR
jgi:hypothetical protein